MIICKSQSMRNIALFLALFFSTNGFSQTLNVVDGNTTPYTPENLITNIFLGDGVTVTGVTFFGDPLSVGYFSDAEDAIGGRLRVSCWAV